MHAKKLIGSVILSFVLAFLVPVVFQTGSDVHASSLKLAHGADTVYVRKTPSGHGKLLATLPKNEPLYIYGKTGSWYKIKYQNSVAYTYEKHVAAGAPILWYKGHGANTVYVRASASGSGKLLTTLPKNQPINVYAQKGSWLTIGYGDGYAYTYKTHVAKGSPSVLYKGYVTDKLYARASASGSGKLLGTLPQFQSVNVYAQKGDWLTVGYNGGYAYSYKTHVAKGSPKVLYKGYVTDKLYARASASGSGKLLGTLPQFQSVNVYAQKGNWLIVGYNGGYAYSYKTHVAKGSPKVLYKGYVTDKLYARASASGSGKLLGTLPKNTSVDVYAQHGDWLTVGYNGGYAYSYKTHVAKGTPPKATANSVTAVTVTSPSPGTQTTSSSSQSSTRKGIDVSKYQGTIDFSKVKAAGCSFVIVKATQGQSGTDPNFLSNIKAANAAGLQTNAYHYYQAGTAADAKAEANHFISVLKQTNVKGYVFVDVESNDTVNALSKATLTSEVNVFLDQLASAGYSKLGIYSNKSFFETKLDESALRPGLLLWIARYNTELGRDADIWQYTDQGSIAGITGSVDIDISYTDEIGS